MIVNILLSCILDKLDKVLFGGVVKRRVDANVPKLDTEVDQGNERLAPLPEVSPKLGALEFLCTCGEGVRHARGGQQALQQTGDGLVSQGGVLGFEPVLSGHVAVVVGATQIDKVANPLAVWLRGLHEVVGGVVDCVVFVVAVTIAVVKLVLALKLATMMVTRRRGRWGGQRRVREVGVGSDLVVGDVTERGRAARERRAGVMLVLVLVVLMVVLQVMVVVMALDGRGGEGRRR